MNRYNNGNDYIGAHSDDEKSLGKNGVVGIVFGATRKFRIRTKDKDRKIVKDVPMKDGTVYWMSGDFNRCFTHEIPKEPNVIGPRTSLTFRRHLH